MSLKITIDEDPRVFTVSIGCKCIGRVTSFAEKGEKNEDVYYAERLTDDDEDGQEQYNCVGDYSSLKAAGAAVCEYEYGPSKIDKVTERIV